jgi:hypothetical protein
MLIASTPYLYQIAQAKVEYLVGRNHLFIGVFVPHGMSADR